MLGLIVMIINFIAIIECESQLDSSNTMKFLSPSNLHVGQLDPSPDTNFQSLQTRFETANKKIQLKSPEIPSNKNNKCPDKNNYLIFSIDKTNKLSRRRRTLSGWLLERPFYVDEPGWVSLTEFNSNYLLNDNKLIKTTEQDPFYLTRGKRNSNLIKLKSLIGNGKKNNLPRRYKHSDILDILHEPFFISRGKKNDNNDNANDDYYGRDSSVNENNRGIYDKRNEGTVNNGYKLLEYDDDDTNRSLRDRRGDFFDQLLKENDPFYVTRG